MRTLLFFCGILCIKPLEILCQTSLPDTSESSSSENAIALYHQFMSPETNLYDGSEYAYNVYYPFFINEGFPFFQAQGFTPGNIYYNKMPFKDVFLMYDVVKDEVLIRDPSKRNIIGLNQERIEWFEIYGQHFTRIVADSSGGNTVKTGFYDELYKGRVSLYEKIKKEVRENNSISHELNTYVIEEDKFFIKKGTEYFPIKNKKALLNVFSDKRKEISQYMKRNKFKLRKEIATELPDVVTYYDKLGLVSTGTDK